MSCTRVKSRSLRGLLRSGRTDFWLPGVASGADLARAGVRTARLVGVEVQPSPSLGPLEKLRQRPGLPVGAVADEHWGLGGVQGTTSPQSWGPPPGAQHPAESQADLMSAPPVGLFL